VIPEAEKLPGTDRRIGVLALQGNFAEHRATLERLGAEIVEVRLPRDLDGLDGLVIPGGESTTIRKLLLDYDLLEPIKRRIDGGLPVLGTCAGAILLARDLGAMDMTVKRNAFGRQLQSFETDLAVAGLDARPLRAIFIRAPAIESVGPGVEVLARLTDGTIVAARQGRLLATAFHAELTDDDRLHASWLQSVPSSGRGVTPHRR
jgi:5'-phosphate synthase pdxT subunit